MDLLGEMEEASRGLKELRFRVELLLADVCGDKAFTRNPNPSTLNAES